MSLESQDSHDSRLREHPDLPLDVPDLSSDVPPPLQRGLSFWLVFLALGVSTALNALEIVSVLYWRGLRAHIS
jgi:hypothetical protein